MMKVVQCWDDGVITDIRLIEILRKYNAKATFNLNPGAHTEQRGSIVWADRSTRDWNHKGFCCGKVGLNELRDIYSGFQVASHCWRHESAGTLPDADFIKAALDARNFLEDVFQQECRGFAWPCGLTTPETVRLMHEAGFAYGRTVKNTDDVTKCADPMLLASNCHFQDRFFWDKYEKARKTGVFYFWGHSYEMMDSPGMWNQIEMKIKEISEDPDAEWANVIDIVPLCRP